MAHELHLSINNKIYENSFEKKNILFALFGIVVLGV